MTGVPLASLPDGLRRKVIDAVRAYNARQPADRTVRVILTPDEPVWPLIVGAKQRLRLNVAIWGNRSDRPGLPIEAVYTLE